MAGIPTAPTADIPTVPTAAYTATQVLAWFNAECSALDASLQNDWFAAGCPDGAGDGCSASPASDARFEQIFTSVQKWLDAALWSASMDQIAGRIHDLHEDMRALWEAYELQFRIMRALVSHTDLGYAHDTLVNTHTRILERAAQRLLEPEPEDSDDELVPCPRNCGDCGGLRYGCGLTRGDFRRGGGVVEPEPEPEPEPHPLDGPQSFQAITASCFVCGYNSDYYAGLLWVPAESLDPLRQIRMIAQTIYDKIYPWQRDRYSTIRWVSRTQDPREAPRESPSGLYNIETRFENLGLLALPLAHDGSYSIGLISHHNMQAWSFKITTVVEGTPEYERFCALPSVWENLGVDIPHTPYVTPEEYAAHRQRLIVSTEAKRAAKEANRAAVEAKRAAFYRTYEESPCSLLDYEPTDRMAHRDE